MELKTFRRREHRARATRTAVDAFTGPVLEHLRERMQAVGFEGEISPECFAELQEALTGFVETSLEHLYEAVAERRQAAHEAPELRTRRDEASRELYDTLVALRHTVRGVFGRTVEHELFGTGKTPRDAVYLVRLGHSLTDRLSRDETRERLSGGRVRFDWDETAEGLSEKTSRLEEVLTELSVNASRQSTAVSQKDDAAAEHDRTQRGMFKVLEGLYEMAGMDSLARKLRPTEPARRGSKPSRPEPVDAETTGSGSRDVAARPDARGSGDPPLPAPLRWVASASNAVERRSKSLESASREGFPASDPPAVARPPGSPSSEPPAVAKHKVRTASDPPGAASHPVQTGSARLGERTDGV